MKKRRVPRYAGSRMGPGLSLGRVLRMALRILLRSLMRR
jgi:hypothetical protein